MPTEVLMSFDMAWVSPQLSRLALTFTVRSDLTSYTTYKNTFDTFISADTLTFRTLSDAPNRAPPKFAMMPVENIFIYGRGTGNRTLIDRLKAGYSSR